MRRIGRVDVFVQRFWNGRQCTLSERLGEVIRACRQAVAEFPQLSTSTTKLAAAQGPGRLAGSFSDQSPDRQCRDRPCARTALPLIAAKLARSPRSFCICTAPGPSVTADRYI